jgi:hypothetical protein
MRRNRLRPTAIAAVALALPFLLGACSQQARAERDGRDLAEAGCDFRKATTAEDAADAKDDFVKQLDDIEDRYGAATAEDRRDIDENLADLAEHAAQGNTTLMQQDLQVLARSAKHIAKDASGVQSAVWQGIADGVQECLQD